MHVEQHQIPVRVVAELAQRVAQLSVGVLWVRDAQDIAEVFATPEEMREASSEVLEQFGVYRRPPNDASAPVRFDRDVWLDRGNLVCFARSAAGNPYCFDFTDGDTPSVVWWNNVTWETVAPTPAEFLAQVSVPPN